MMANIEFEKGKFIDDNLKSNLDIVKNSVYDNWDGFIIVTGIEGSGKSILTEQMAYYLDRTYNLSRCVFTTEEFLKAVDEAEQYQAIVLDEAHGSSSSLNRFDPFNVALMQKMTMIRKKNLFLFFTQPDFFTILKYYAVHRSMFLINVFARANYQLMKLERGYYRLYSRDVKKILYEKGKRRFGDMNVVKPTFEGRFKYWRVLDNNAYDLKKERATLEILNTFKGGRKKGKFDKDLGDFYGL